MTDLLKKVWCIFDKKQRREVFFQLIIIILGSLLELFGVTMLLPLIDLVADESLVNENRIYILIGEVFSLHTIEQYIIFIAIILIVTFTIKNIFALFLVYSQSEFVAKNQFLLETKLYKRYLSLDYINHTMKNVVDLQRNITRDISFFFAGVTATFNLFAEVLVSILLFLFLVCTDYVSTICITLFLAGFMCIFGKIYKKRLVKITTEQRELFTNQNKLIIESFEGIKDVKARGSEGYFFDTFKTLANKTARRSVWTAVLQNMARPTMEMVCMGVLLTVIVLHVLVGKSVKDLAAIISVFAIAAIRLLPAANRIVTSVAIIMGKKTNIDSLYKEICINEDPENVIDDKDDGHQFVFEGNFNLNSICFKYSNAKENVIDELSMTFPVLSSVAIVGTSGAGKSTLADIILGILNPDKGTITLNNDNILEHRTAWKRTVGYIPQTVFLLNDSIRNNVAFAVDDVDDDKVMAALDVAQLGEFVRSLPDGLDTKVGERGVRLSGGQRQRIGIARALYFQPQYLVFDEATAALDNETERAFMDTIRQMQGKVGMLIIAHRLTTVRNCDYIYEIVQGKAVLRSKEWIEEQIVENS